jgi:hypothetical protein
MLFTECGSDLNQVDGDQEVILDASCSTCSSTFVPTACVDLCVYVLISATASGIVSKVSEHPLSLAGELNLELPFGTGIYEIFE